MTRLAAMLRSSSGILRSLSSAETPQSGNPLPLHREPNFSEMRTSAKYLANHQIHAPSLIAIATTRLVTKVLKRNNLPTSLATLACGDVDLSKALTENPNIPLVSFTGSEKIGKIVGGVVQSR